MRVLIGCECSGKVRDAFARLGWDAWSCDLVPSDRPGNHIVADVLSVLDRGWNLVILHPPCTYLAASGQHWLRSRCTERYPEFISAVQFFLACLNAPVPYVAVENPRIHNYALDFIPRSTQKIQPWQFGHGETKETHLWLRNLPPLVPTNIVEGREARIHQMPPGETRQKLRSETYQGIADAMAEQWTAHILANATRTV